MPRLPDQFSLGNMESLYVRVPTPTASQADAGAIGHGMQGLAQGLGQVASAAGNYADEEQKKKDALELLKADTEHKKGLANLDDQFENDTDYATQKQRHAQQADAIAQQAAAGITNDNARQQFLLRSQQHNIGATQRVGRNANNMQKQQMVGELEDKLDFYHDQYADRTADDDKREAAHKAMDDAIYMGEHSGIINPRQANTYRKKYLFDSASDEIKDLIAQGRYEEAQKKIDEEALNKAALRKQTAPAGKAPGLAAAAAPSFGAPASNTNQMPDAQEVAGPGQPTEQKPLQERLVPGQAPAPQMAGGQAAGEAGVQPEVEIGDNSADQAAGATQQAAPQRAAVTPTQFLEDRRNAPSKNVKNINPIFQNRLAALIEGAEEAGFKVGIASGARTKEEQTRIAATAEPGYAASPGHSFHEKGTAADLWFGSPKNKLKDADPAALKWIHDHAAEYGVYFPLDGVKRGPAEPWHAEPLGFTRNSEFGKEEPVFKGGIGAGGQVPAQAGASRIGELADNDKDRIIRTALGEVGANASPAEKASVIHVILNRLSLNNKQFGANVDEVTRPSQFEPWSRPEKVREMNKYDPDGAAYASTKQVLEDILAGKLADNTSGATHFYSPGGQAQEGRAPPNWSRWQNTANIGGHKFYQDPQFADQLASSPAVAPAQGGGATQTSQPSPPQGMSEESVPRLPGRFGVLSPLDRQMFSDQIREAKIKDGQRNLAAIKEQVKNDTASLEKTGTVPVDENGRTSLDRAREIIKDNSHVPLAHDWEQARRTFAARAPLADMSEDDMNRHIGQFVPDESSPDFKMNDAVVTKAKAARDEILAQRSRDMALASDQSREVQQVHHDYNNPPPVQQLDGSFAPGPRMSPVERMQAVVQARRAAQERWDIHPDDQKIITRDEAKTLLNVGEHPEDLGDEVFTNRMNVAVENAKKIYGPEARTAFEQATRMLISGKEDKQIANFAATKLMFGGTLTPDDLRNLSNARMFLDPMTPALEAITAPRVDYSLRDNQGVSQAAIAASLPIPNKGQIELLKQSPDNWQAFDRKFGAGASARALGFLPKKNLAPAEGQQGPIGRMLSGPRPMAEERNAAFRGAAPIPQGAPQAHDELRRFHEAGKPTGVMAE